ncbi:MAG: YebC/PmpR family DNA-binding transcriptional regulator [Oscillospiraceae bacterium]|nr:YebC/PmpR family DNA-binding transcriptional regulator [Oscillospiraceae bacterium]
MSGHSKWKTIQARKTKVDAQRGKIFTKLGREILMAVKAGGPDLNSNAKLRDVVAKAKANNMPNDTISNAIKKASGENNSKVYDEVTYEGYGPSGVALIVNVSTDNKNRTASEVRHAFDKAGGNLGTTGCVSYLFERKGVIVLEKSANSISEDELVMISIDAGADDFEVQEDYYEITTSPENFSKVREVLEKQNLVFAQAEVQMLPKTYIELDEKSVEQMQNLIDKLEELDDVIEVFHNWGE